ncbi:hypothetical protein [uncultured Megasphaera sp.]|uniref:hypothetical protein n=1 Tax=uncultured Megasphaera sp. TaxID=165188 RepID=UPI00259B0BBC|nr:hypothetical protein [uncultured Megasphaera sp.]
MALLPYSQETAYDREKLIFIMANKNRSDTLWRKIRILNRKERHMEYNEVRKQLEMMMNTNYKAVIMALISIERDMDNEAALQELYNLYMDNDRILLLNEVLYR